MAQIWDFSRSKGAYPDFGRKWNWQFSHQEMANPPWPQGLPPNHPAAQQYPQQAPPFNQQPPGPQGWNFQGQQNPNQQQQNKQEQTQEFRFSKALEKCPNVKIDAQVFQLCSYTAPAVRDQEPERNRQKQNSVIAVTENKLYFLTKAAQQRRDADRDAGQQNQPQQKPDFDIRRIELKKTNQTGVNLYIFDTIVREDKLFLATNFGVYASSEILKREKMPVKIFGSSKPCRCLSYNNDVLAFAVGDLVFDGAFQREDCFVYCVELGWAAGETAENELTKVQALQEIQAGGYVEALATTSKYVIYVAQKTNGSLEKALVIHLKNAYEPPIVFTLTGGLEKISFDQMVCTKDTRECFNLVASSYQGAVVDFLVSMQGGQMTLNVFPIIMNGIVLKKQETFQAQLMEKRHAVQIGLANEAQLKELKQPRECGQITTLVEGRDSIVVGCSTGLVLRIGIVCDKGIASVSSVEDVYDAKRLGASLLACTMNMQDNSQDVFVSIAPEGKGYESYVVQSRTFGARDTEVRIQSYELE